MVHVCSVCNFILKVTFNQSWNIVSFVAWETPIICCAMRVCAIKSNFWCCLASWCRVVWVERGQLQIPIEGSFELIEREPIARQSSLGSHWYQCSRSDAEILLSSARLLLWHPMDQPQWWGHWSHLQIFIFAHKGVAPAWSIEPSPFGGSKDWWIVGLCPYLYSAS